ncbi:hypothetical protein ACE01N_20465 [Saccharicrinis sp. FJH2]|uniref:hypothetical protein n=1 Tax=Saccharicrinis sp. FJH65 TaxID=3344659 RepID=UPI0035F41A61
MNKNALQHAVIVHGSTFKPNNSTFAASSFHPDSSYPIGQKLPRHHTAGTLCAI